MKHNINEHVKRIDSLIEESKREDIFIKARQKLRELKQDDYSIESLTLTFKSRALGVIEVPVYADD